MSFVRTDAGTLGKVQRTEQGGIIVPASLTRAGIFTYMTASGEIQREFRPPEEVFKQDSLNSYEHAPVTELHPQNGELVNPENYQRLSKGHGTKAQASDNFVSTRLVVQDASVIKKVINKELVEVSLGYSVDLEHTPGEYNGERYDAVQRNIKVNHIALGPSGWGRMGGDVKIRLDSKGHELFPSEDNITKKQKETKMTIIRVDGVDFEEDSAALKAYTSLQQEKKALLEEKNKLQARADANEAMLKEQQKEVAAAVEKGRQEALQEADLRAFASQAKINLDSRCDSLSSLKVAIASALFPSIKLDGQSDSYVSALIDAARQDSARSRATAPRSVAVNAEIRQDEDFVTKLNKKMDGGVFRSGVV